MLISKVLFSTRVRRALLPGLCLLLASIAMALGDRHGLVLALAIVLVAVLSKVTAELSGRLSRLGSRWLAARQDIDETMATLQSQADRLAAAESKLDALNAEFEAAEAHVEAQHQKLVDEVGRIAGQLDGVVEGLQPIRRHRLFETEPMPDLSLRPSTEMLLRRFRRRP